MNRALQKIFFTFGALFTAVALILLFGTHVVLAQNAGESSFQITSSKDISAIQGESFTYFVVTENNTDYQLQSQLPAGVSFTNGSISGTPQEAGDYQLDFVANTEGAPTETVNLTVLSSSQNQGGQQSVSLEEVPETGLSADQTITLTFYLLALLLLSYWGVSRFSKKQAVPAEDTSNRTRAHVKTHEKESSRKNRSVGDEIISN